MKKMVNKMVYPLAVLGAFGLGRALYSPKLSDFSMNSQAYASLQANERDSFAENPAIVDSRIKREYIADLENQVSNAEENLLKTIQLAQQIKKEDEDRRFERKGSLYRAVELISSQIELTAKAQMNSRPVPSENIALYAKEMRESLLKEIERIRQINPDYVEGFP